MSLDVTVIKNLRDETGAGILDIKRALENASGDYEQAKAELVKKGLAKAAKKDAERITKDGLVHSYIHAGGKVGSLVKVACETDFVAKNQIFKTLCHDIAMQVCCGEYENVDQLLESEFIKESNKTIGDLVKEAVAKLGEKIEVKDFVKFSVFD